MFSLLYHIQQLRGLMYYRLLRVMMVVIHNDIECCYLLPNKPEQARGILADEYYQNEIKHHAQKINRRRFKIIKYLEDGFQRF